MAAAGQGAGGGGRPIDPSGAQSGLGTGAIGPGGGSPPGPGGVEIGPPGAGSPGRGSALIGPPSGLPPPPGSEPISPDSGSPLGPTFIPPIPMVGGVPIRPLAAAGITPPVSARGEPPVIETDGRPVGGQESRFNIGGAPIAILGGVFSGGLPLGGPVTQIFRGGSGPMPNTLFIATITDSGPIGAFLIGGGGAPIGVDTIGGGGLPIGLSPQLAVEVAAIGPRTAEVGPIAVAFGGTRTLPTIAPTRAAAGR